ncbi:ribonuclease P/MRP protein subunit RPP1 [Apostasia shenzhenica]|uniref:Ribonuclease P/MRP protein subunit RPP1 n=1 Tax=Apostasia shenzhenica TaxID=1088818 RepID=A0A2I0A8Q0_9ASPA|nr:ribonuclease P/MRP protein subunit RPP1 [Apostasia shenzhenica]
MFPSFHGGLSVASLGGSCSVFDSAAGSPPLPPPPFSSPSFLHCSSSSSSSDSFPFSFGITDPLDPLHFHPHAVRRSFSFDDLWAMNGSLHSTEVAATAASGSSSGVGSGKVGRYSAEERRERIERYRSKRNQRNFHKKITVRSLQTQNLAAVPLPFIPKKKKIWILTAHPAVGRLRRPQYACRKTLADNRPRVRGRFARNGEAEAETERPDFGGGAGGDWWSQMQAALLTADEELWASLQGVLAMDASSYLS